MKKTITIYYPLGDWLDVKIRDECIQQSRGNSWGTLQNNQKHEVIGSRVDWRDFSKVVSELCKKYDITEQQLFILEEYIDELSILIWQNQEMNAEEIMRKNAQIRLGNMDSMLDYEGIDAYVKMSDCKSNWVDKAIYKHTVEINKGTPLYNDIVADFGSIKNYFEELETEHEMGRDELEDFERNYPVDCKRIYEEYCHVLDVCNIKWEIHEYYKNQEKQATEQAEKYRELSKQYA